MASEAMYFSAAPGNGSRHAPSASRPSTADLRTRCSEPTVSGHWGRQNCRLCKTPDPGHVFRPARAQHELAHTSDGLLADLQSSVCPCQEFWNGAVTHHPWDNRVPSRPSPRMGATEYSPRRSEASRGIAAPQERQAPERGRQKQAPRRAVYLKAPRRPGHAGRTPAGPHRGKLGGGGEPAESVAGLGP